MRCGYSRKCRTIRRLTVGKSAEPRFEAIERDLNLPDRVVKRFRGPSAYLL